MAEVAIAVLDAAGIKGGIWTAPDPWTPANASVRYKTYFVTEPMVAKR